MDLYYLEKGNGYPIILLHGNQENHTIFSQLIDDLGDFYHVIAMDSRYHGKSIKQGPLTLEQMAKDVMRVADELNLESYDVIGFSDGANIALTLAPLDPRLKHMILMSPNANPQGIKRIYRIQMFLTMICLLPFCLYHPKARLSFKLYRFMFDEPHFTREELSDIKIPILLLGGTRDMIRQEDFEFFASALPHCILKVIEGTHFLLGSNYPELKKAISGFLNACHHFEEDNP